MTIAIAETTKTSLALPPKSFGDKEVFYPESDGEPMGETAFHIKCLLMLFQTLETYFRKLDDIVIIGDMMFYYEEGNPYKVISPDLMVVKGVGKHLRRVFKLWEENTPEVVFEISSRGTWREDLQKKYFLYQSLGVKEYYIFDPEYDYLPNALIAYQLKKGEFQEVKVKKGRIFSPDLGLEIVDTGEGLRLYNPETKSFLLTNEEFADKLSVADEEIQKLKAELAKLKKQK